MYRRSLAFVVVALMLVAGAGSAQEQGTQEGAPLASCPPAPEVPSRERIAGAMKEARDHGFLWRLVKDGRTSFLYGTVHLATLDMMFPGPSVRQAAQASDRFAFELDMLDADIVGRLQAAVIEGHDTVLSEALTERLHKLADRACVERAALDRIFPEMRVATLYALAGRADGIYADYGIDVFLAGYARGLKKPVSSLEEPEQQIALLHAPSAQERDQMLAEQLDLLEGPEAAAKTKHLVEVWAESRFEELQTYLQWCACAETENDRRELRRMIDDRNPGLAEHIDAIHREGASVFAAVGMLHMIGSAALPDLLAQRGYTVERVVFGR